MSIWRWVFSGGGCIPWTPLDPVFAPIVSLAVGQEDTTQLPSCLAAAPTCEVTHGEAALTHPSSRPRQFLPTPVPRRPRLLRSLKILAPKPTWKFFFMPLPGLHGAWSTPRCPILSLESISWLRYFCDICCYCLVVLCVSSRTEN